MLCRENRSQGLGVRSKHTVRVIPTYRLERHSAEPELFLAKLLRVWECWLIQWAVQSYEFMRGLSGATITQSKRGQI